MTHVIKAMRDLVLKSNSSPFSPQKNSCFNDDQASMAYVSIAMMNQPFDPSNPLGPLEPFDPVERPFLPRKPFAQMDQVCKPAHMFVLFSGIYPKS